MSSENRKIALGLQTRSTLIAKARTLFRRGFEAVGTPEVAAAADVTRGALYHHFKNKKDLFAAVVEEVAADMVRRIEDAAEGVPDSPVDGIVEGSRAFLRACADEETRQIFLVDAPAVLGWAAWREIDARHGLGSLREGLQFCAEHGYLDADDVDTVAHLISGALNEAAFVMAQGHAETSLARRVDAKLELMIRGLLFKG